jgi:hypothetical protein
MPSARARRSAQKCPLLPIPPLPIFAEAPFARSQSTALAGDGAKPLRAIRTV